MRVFLEALRKGQGPAWSDQPSVLPRPQGALLLCAQLTGLREPPCPWFYLQPGLGQLRGASRGTALKANRGENGSSAAVIEEGQGSPQVALGLTPCQVGRVLRKTS